MGRGGGHFVRQPENIDWDLSWLYLSGAEREGQDPIEGRVGFENLNSRLSGFSA
jgi:hypothetical protein